MSQLLSTMAVSFITFTLQAVLLASTFSSCAWAMDNLTKPNSPVGSYTITSSGAQPTGPVMQSRPPPTGCRPQDISIMQRQMPGTGTPRFEVAITNTCVDHKCSIQKIMAFCGQFSTAYPINPNVFRRVNNGPTCVVNNLLPMSSSQSLTFRYDTEFMEPIHLVSAEPICRQ